MRAPIDAEHGEGGLLRPGPGSGSSKAFESHAARTDGHHKKKSEARNEQPVGLGEHS